MNPTDRKAVNKIMGCGCGMLIYGAFCLGLIAAIAFAIRWVIRTA